MKIRRAILFVILAILLTAAVAYAGTTGTLNPTAPPGSTSSYTLKDIYQRLDTGAAGSQSTWTEPAAGPGASIHTLNEIMGAAPAVDDTDGATAAQVMSGKTYWSLRSGGEWGPKTGTAAVGSDVSGADGEKTFNIPDGFYTDKTATANDSDLLAENIKSGVNILGVDGNLIAGNTYNAAVRKSGATTSYATGDDGDLKKGLAWPVPRFTDNGDGTVTDNLTGLIWLKNARCANAGTTLPTALLHVASLNSTGTMNGNNCGDTSNGGSHQTDWRLPNRPELESLIHHGVYSVGGYVVPNTLGTGQWTEGDPFTNLRLQNYWSSTYNAGTLSTTAPKAWYVRFSDGSTDSPSITVNSEVWAVRGGQ